MWGIVTGVVLRRVWLEARTGRPLPVRALAGLGVSAILMDAGIAWGVTGGTYAWLPLLLQRLPRGVATAGAIGALALLTRTVALRVAAMARRAHSATVMAHAQDALHAVHLHPHFLFNTLAMLAESMQDDRRRGQELVRRFSGLASQVARLETDARVPLRRELEAVHDYLALVRERFAYALRLEVDADDTSLSMELPPLVLQPLIENALRHGVVDPVRGGVIRIIARARDDALHLTVEDDGRGATLPIEHGTGLRGVVARLAACHPRARLTTRGRPGTGLAVDLVVPAPAEVAHASVGMESSAGLPGRWRPQMTQRGGGYLLIVLGFLFLSDWLTPALLGVNDRTPLLPLYRLGWTVCSTLACAVGGWYLAHRSVRASFLIAAGVLMAHLMALIEVRAIQDTLPAHSLVLFVRFLYVSLVAMVAFAAGATWCLLARAESDERATIEAERLTARLSADREALRDAMMVLRTALDDIAGAVGATAAQLEAAIERLAAVLREILQAPTHERIDVTGAAAHLAEIRQLLAPSPVPTRAP